MNFTLAGPVCPLGPMFAAMDARAELDFWGLTRHYAMQSRRFGGAVPEHLQSHFLALRPRLFNSDAFWDYWQQMALPASYEQSVILHETRFTPYFAAKGYIWDTYVNTDDLCGVFVNPIMACPVELLQKRDCPFFQAPQPVHALCRRAAPHRWLCGGGTVPLCESAHGVSR